MTTKTAIANFEGPRRNYFFPLCEEEMISEGQRRTLTELILCNIDEEKREGYINQISDITKAEADDWILEFTMGRWK